MVSFSVLCFQQTVLAGEAFFFFGVLLLRAVSCRRFISEGLVTAVIAVCTWVFHCSFSRGCDHVHRRRKVDTTCTSSS